MGMRPIKGYDEELLVYRVAFADQPDAA
jgi:hypothetical protein